MLLETWDRQTCSGQGCYKPAICEILMSVRCDIARYTCKSIKLAYETAYRLPWKILRDLDLGQWVAMEKTREGHSQRRQEREGVTWITRFCLRKRMRVEYLPFPVTPAPSPLGGAQKLLHIYSEFRVGVLFLNL